MGADGAVAEAAEVDRLRRRRQGIVVGGLLLTMAGLYSVLGILPSDPGTLARDLPFLGFGLVALWVGGILLGLGKGRGTRRRR